MTFGSEPNDTEIQKFILYKYSKLKFSDTVFVKSRPKIVSPKRMKRVVNKQLNKAVPLNKTVILICIFSTQINLLFSKTKNGQP